MRQLHVARGVPEHPAKEPDQRMDHLAADQRERVHQNHVPAQPGGLDGGGQPRDPGTHDADIAANVVLRHVDGLGNSGESQLGQGMRHRRSVQLQGRAAESLNSTAAILPGSAQ